MQENANILSTIFGRQSSYVFYSGGKQNWTNHEGFHRFRSDLIKEFFGKQKGFQILVSALLTGECAWFGANNMINVLDACKEAAREDILEKQQLVTVLHKVSAMLLRAKEEEVKRDDARALNGLMDNIVSIYNFTGEPQVDFHRFWMAHTQKLMTSGFMNLRLFAWEEVSKIIAEAEWTKPLALEYVVSGAGCEEVNGTYTFLRKQVDKDRQWSIIYHKEATEEDHRPLSLIRCKMKDDCKKWFFSDIVDTNNPGTNADIDYYNQERKVPSNQRYLEREPPESPGSWEVSKAGKEKARGFAPMPRLQKKGVYLEEGQETGNFLIELIPVWFRSGNLLDTVFGLQNINREIVSRSRELLQHMACHLTPNDLKVVWNAAMKISDIVIVEEVLVLLVELSKKLNYELFNSLLNIAGDTLEEGTEQGYAKIAIFVEKYARNNFSVLSSLEDEAASSLTPFLWRVYGDSRFGSLKTCETIEKLLSTCLGSVGGESTALERVEECVTSLRSCLQATSAKGRAETEKTACSAVHTLQFLISKNTRDSTIKRLKDEVMLPEVVVAELERYVENNRLDEKLRMVPEGSASASKNKSGVASCHYASAIQDRLQVLIQFYSYTETKMPQADAEALCSLLSKDRLELAEAHRLLLAGVSESKNSGKAIFTPDVAHKLFTTYLCGNELDWSMCSYQTLLCFSHYHANLKRLKEPNTSLSSGSDTDSTGGNASIVDSDEEEKAQFACHVADGLGFALRGCG